MSYNSISVDLSGFLFRFICSREENVLQTKGMSNGRTSKMLTIPSIIPVIYLTNIPNNASHHLGVSLNVIVN